MNFKIRLFQILGVAALLLALLYLIGTAVGVPFVARMLLDDLQQGLDEAEVGSINYESLRFNPFILEVSIRGLSVSGPESEEFLRIEHILVNAQAATLFQQFPILHHVEVSEVELVIDDEARAFLEKISSLLPQDSREGRVESSEVFKAPTLPPMRIDRLALNNISALLKMPEADEDQAFGIRNLVLEEFTFDTSETHSNEIRVQFETPFEETANLTATLQFDPLSLAGEVTLEGFRTGEYRPLVEPVLDDLSWRGVVEAGSSFTFAPFAEQPLVKLNQAHFRLSDFEISLEAEDTQLKGNEFKIQVAEIDFIEGLIDIQELSLADIKVEGILALRKGQTGDADIPAIQSDIEPDEQTLNDLTGQLPFALKSLEDWELRMGTMALENVSLAAGLDREGRLGQLPGISLESFTLEDLSTNGNQPARIKSLITLAAPGDSLEPMGTVTFQGELDLSEGLALVAQTNLETIDLAASNSVLPLFLPVAEASGSMEVSMTTRVTLSASNWVALADSDTWQSLRARLALDLEVQQLGAEISERPLMRTKAIGLEGLEVSWPEKTVRIAELSIDSGNITLHRDEAGRLPWQTNEVARNEPAITSKPAPDTTSPQDIVSQSASEFQTGSETQMETATTEHQENEIPLAGDTESPLVGEAEIPSAGELESNENDSSGSRTPSQEWDIEVAQLSVTNGSLSWSDTAHPGLLLVATNASLSNSGTISSNAEQPFELLFQTEVGRSGKVSGNATLTLPGYQPHGNVTVTTTDLAIARFSPIAEPIIGYRIESGSLNVVTLAELKGSRIKAENDIRLETFALSTDRVNDSTLQLPVPIKTAVGLMKDSSGTIKLRVPIPESDLARPDISIASLVGQAFQKVLGSLLISPFKLLGGIVGAGEEDSVRVIPFEAGTSDLTEEGKRHLDKALEALEKRPEIAFGIHGSIDPEADVLAMQRELLSKALQEHVKARIWLSSGSHESSHEDYKETLESFAKSLELGKGETEVASQKPVGVEAENASLKPDDASLTAAAEKLQTETAKPTPKKTNIRRPERKEKTLSKLEKDLLAAFVVEPESLKALALTRAEIVYEAFLAAEIEAKRLRLDEAGFREEGAEVQFTLE